MMINKINSAPVFLTSLILALSLGVSAAGSPPQQTVTACGSGWSTFDATAETATKYSSSSASRACKKAKARVEVKLGAQVGVQCAICPDLTQCERDVEAIEGSTITCDPAIWDITNQRWCVTARYSGGEIRVQCKACDDSE